MGIFYYWYAIGTGSYKSRYHLGDYSLSIQIKDNKDNFLMVYNMVAHILKVIQVGVDTEALP